LLHDRGWHVIEETVLLRECRLFAIDAHRLVVGVLAASDIVRNLMTRWNRVIDYRPPDGVGCLRPEDWRS
jgi:hypothetical protein